MQLTDSLCYSMSGEILGIIGGAKSVSKTNPVACCFLWVFLNQFKVYSIDS